MKYIPLIEGDRVTGFERYNPQIHEANLPKYTFKEIKELTPKLNNIMVQIEGEEITLHETVIEPTSEEKEERRLVKVKAKLAQELPDLIYANKDDPAVLVAAMCDRAKEIDAETTVEPTPVKELER